MRKIWRILRILIKMVKLLWLMSVKKDITMRIAIAEGSIKVNQEVFRSIKEQTNKKGDVLAVARIAGIMAAKKNK